MIEAWERWMDERVPSWRSDPDRFKVLKVAFEAGWSARQDQFVEWGKLGAKRGGRPRLDRR